MLITIASFAIRESRRFGRNVVKSRHRPPRVRSKVAGWNIGSSWVPVGQTPKRLTFSGTDWIEHSPNGAVMIYREKSLLQFDAAGPHAAGGHRAITIRAAEALERSNEENLQPRFAGTFWRSQQLAFVETHRAQARAGDPSEVGSIHCEVCEIDITAEEMTQLVPVRIPSLRRSGGVLRLHVAPQLGFVLPLVEVCTVEGTPVVTYRCDDWAEMDLAQTLYFPRQARMEVALPSGSKVYEKFTITPKMLNQPVDDEELSVDVPVGTQILDDRSASPDKREVVRSATTSDKLLGRGLRKSSSESTANDHASGSRGRLIVILVVIAVVVATGVLLTVRARNRNAA